MKINLFLLVSLVLNRAIPASINYYLLLMRYIVLLMKALKLEVSSLISQRHLIRSGSRNLLNLLHDFLNERKQLVVLDGQFSTWKNINTGVPQGSILDPFLFLIYINDLIEGLSFNTKLLQLIRLCFWLYITFKLLQVILIKI